MSSAASSSSSSSSSSISSADSEQPVLLSLNGSPSSSTGAIASPLGLPSESDSELEPVPEPPESESDSVSESDSDLDSSDSLSVHSVHSVHSVGEEEQPIVIEDDDDDDYIEPQPPPPPIHRPRRMQIHRPPTNRSMPTSSGGQSQRQASQSQSQSHRTCRQTPANASTSVVAVAATSQAQPSSTNQQNQNSHQQQRQESQSTSSPAIKRRRTHALPPSVPSPKEKTMSTTKFIEEDEEEGNQCPICLEAWTNSGEHQICCTPCGHLFGYSCLKEWFKSNQSSRRSSSKQACPSCKHPGRVRDIRFLFGLPSKPSVADMTKSEGLQKSLDGEIGKHNRTKEKIAERQRLISTLRMTVRELRQQLQQQQQNNNPSTGGGGNRVRILGGSSSISNVNSNTQEQSRRERNSNDDIITRNSLQSLASTTSEGETQTVAFDREARLIIPDKFSNSSTGIPRYRLKRLTLTNTTSSTTRPTLSPSTFTKKIASISICTDTHSPFHGNIAAAVSSKSIHILTADMQSAGIFSTPTQPTACTWLSSNPHVLAVGQMTGDVCLFDIRFAGSGALSHCNVDLAGWRLVHSLSEVCVSDGGGKALIAGAPRGVYGAILNASDLKFERIYTPNDNENEKVCGVSASNESKVIGITSRSDEHGGCVMVHDGIVNGPSSSSSLELGHSIGQTIRGLGFDQPFSRAAVMDDSQTSRRDAVVVCPDSVKQGGIAAWTLTSSNNNSNNNDNYDAKWESVSVNEGICFPTLTGSGNRAMKGAVGFMLPRSARMEGLPSFCKSLFACYSDTNVRAFTCGRYHQITGQRLHSRSYRGVAEPVLNRPRRR